MPEIPRKGKAYEVREGQTVQYRTVPCVTPDSGQDIDLYCNYERGVRTKPIWRPAIVLRVWSGGLCPCVDLRVLADSDGTFDRFRASVPHKLNAEKGGPAWQRMEEEGE